MTDTPPEQRPAADNSEIKDARFFSAIGHLSVLCFVPILLKKENSFAQFHGKQGLVLFILEVAAFILRIVPVLGELVFTMSVVVFGILSLIGIVKVLMGERWEMPVVYDISSRISL